MVDLHSSREAESAHGPPSATERREWKSRVTLFEHGRLDPSSFSSLSPSKVGKLQCNREMALEITV